MPKTAAAQKKENDDSGNKPARTIKKKPIDRKMNPFMNKLARKVGTSTSSAVDAELDKMYRFVLARLANTAQLIDTVYAKSETIKPSHFHAAVQTLMIDSMRDSAMEVGADAVAKHIADKKSGKKKADGDDAEDGEGAHAA